MSERKQEELLARLLAGETLTPEHRALLESSANADASMAVDQVLLDRLLRYHFTNADRSGFTAEVLARLEAATAAPLRGKVLRHLAWQRWRWAAAAAVVLLAGTLWLRLRPDQTAAGIVASTGAVWPQGEGRVPGASLAKGERLRLASGFVSLRFASGAEVLLEGAADMEITGENSATLHRGSAVARVPESAQGFSISSAQGRVVDLGTEFAVKADAAGMEVHVLEGSVEAHPTGRDMVAVGTDKALRLDAAGAVTIASAPDQFLTALPPDRSAAPGWLHWSFDEGAGSSVQASGVSLPVEQARGTLTSLPGGSRLPAWTTGVRGTGIELYGKDDYIQTGYPGISGTGPRTVACWVRVPRDFSREGFALVSWGAHQSWGDTWQMSINPRETEGPVGRLRIGTHNGHVIGVRDLRDGQWHHVAAVLYGGRDPDVSTHALLYVDGVLEPAATKTVRRVRTDTDSRLAQPVAFGKNSAIREAAENSWDSHTFRGSIDEITLCAEALSETDIRLIMARGMASLP